MQQRKGYRREMKLKQRKCCTVHGVVLESRSYGPGERQEMKEETSDGTHHLTSDSELPFVLAFEKKIYGSTCGP
jgi:hypothetical protein